MNQQNLDKDEIALLQKPWVKNHTTLTNDHILELYRLFNLYCNPRTRRIDLKDVMITAQQLGLVEKSPIVANTLQQVSDQHGDGGVDFEEFVRELTSKLGNTFDQKGREQLFTLVDIDGKGTLDKDDLRKISDELHLNFSQKDIDEIIHNVSGYDAEDITAEQFEKYLAKLTNRRKIETEVLRTK
ncbi:unnamed protein product [Paramecium octaurelia]|uniref:EF-hand domain-containing protein n=1 Tax=Paramecium octaurelia TaxID=43137 RepID=A0A8S1V9I2_PAROT|nr:unnamed protein product [Paramecium octaurelia]